MSEFKFNCPHCKQALEAPQDMLGETIECPSCTGSIQIPDPEPKTQPGLQPSAAKAHPMSRVSRRTMISICSAIVVAAVLATGWGLHRRAKAKPFIRAAYSHIERSQDVSARVGSPINFGKTRCYFGLKSKDPSLVQAMDESQRMLADAIVWVECEVSGPEGNAMVVAWMLSSGGYPGLYRLMVADTDDKDVIRKLISE